MQCHRDSQAFIWQTHASSRIFLIEIVGLRVDQLVSSLWPGVMTLESLTNLVAVSSSLAHFGFLSSCKWDGLA